MNIVSGSTDDTIINNLPCSKSALVRGRVMLVERVDVRGSVGQRDENGTQTDRYHRECCWWIFFDVGNRFFVVARNQKQYAAVIVKKDKWNNIVVNESWLADDSRLPACVAHKTTVNAVTCEVNWGMNVVVIDVIVFVRDKTTSLTAVAVVVGSTSDG